ncbi:MAG: xylulokinase [Verrucomicrobiales bacterium]|jgi:xylulokinase|nr:xylulokinase [Verrucomicrobiales bacterium]
MSEYFIGVDSGTQSTKAIIIDGKNGKILASASVAYGLISGLPTGAKEQHPKTWVKAMEEAIKKALAAGKIKAAAVKGIGVSGQQHGFVPLDEKGNVIRPAKLWCDTSTSAQAESLLTRLGGLEKTVALTGNGIPAGFTASKIAWLKQYEPQNFDKLHTVLLPHDYLNFHLTGNRRMEAGDASGTGFFDVKTRRWSGPVINAIDPFLAEKLPQVSPSDQPSGELKHDVAKRLGLNAGVVVSSGGGDNMMAAIGTGNTKVGVVTASLGTSGTIFAHSSRPVVDPLGEVAGFCDSTGGWLPLICTMNVTVATELFKKAWKWDNERLTGEAAKIPAGADGLVLLPYFEGERTPNLPAASGVYFGINSHNFTHAHMARATLEGVAFGLNYGLDRLKDLGVRPKQIRLTGGGSKNPLWRQILADVFETEVIGLATAEGAAYGAAIQAKWNYAVASGGRVRLQQITDAFVKTDAGTRALPNKKNLRLYKAMQLFHDRLSAANAKIFNEHALLRQIR